MTRITERRLIDAPIDRVWSVVSDPDVYAAVAPNLAAVEIVEGSEEDTIRRCVDTDGNEWTESYTYWEEGRGFAVAVDVANSEFHHRLFTRFEGEWRLDERAGGVLVTIAFDFDTRYGPLGWLVAKYLAVRAPPLIEAIFDGWEAELARRGATADGPTGGADASRTPANGLYR